MVASLRILLRVVPFIFFFSACVLQPQHQMTDADVGLITLNEEHLRSLKKELKSNSDTTVTRAYKNLIDKADHFLTSAPLTVAKKSFTPPSGNKHDYMSLATYAWPNPDSDDGLPYIIRDGQRNPEVDNYDRPKLTHLSNSAFTLALAYFYSDKSIYAQKAAQFIDAWFLNESTYMTSHLTYAQFIPGVTNGGVQGIIETRDFIPVLDAVSLIYESKYWSNRQQYRLKIWFDNYLNWLIDKRGGDISSANIGTWRDAQVAAYSVFTEQERVGLSYINHLFKERTINQINAAGIQEHEVKRFKSQHYTWFNLQGNLKVISIGRKMGWDITDHPHLARNIRKALNWLMPYATGNRKWEYKQTEEFDSCRYIEIYRQAAHIFNSQQYESVVQDLLTNGCLENQAFILYPKISSY